MPKRKETLKRQDSFTVRIPDDMDEGCLRWLNDVRQKRVLQRVVIEAIHVLYEKNYSIPGKWIPLSPKTGKNVDRELLRWVVKTQEVAPSVIQKAPASDNEAYQSSELTVEVDKPSDKEILGNALEFLLDK